MTIRDFVTSYDNLVWRIESHIKELVIKVSLTDYFLKSSPSVPA